MPVAPLILVSWSSALGITLAILAVAFCAFWGYVWYLYFPIVVNLIGRAPMLLPEATQPIAGGEECEFPTTHGLTLRGTYVKHRNGERRGVILFGHELNGDRWNATPYVVDLLDAGYDIFTFDFRNHGASDADPKFTPRPWTTTYDAADFRAAIDYVMSRPDADPRGVGVLGISRGGGAAMSIVGGDARVRCLFTDGAYPTRTTHMLYVRRYVDIYVPEHWHWLSRRFPNWGFELFLNTARKVWGRSHHYPMVDVETAASSITQPVLMIHGAADTMIPVDAAKALRKYITGPSKLWVVPEAKHNAAVFTEPDAYRRRLLKFFRLHLAPRENRNQKSGVRDQKEVSLTSDR
jgi:pimeloyl-ACP methyl ester carboxylesterase